MENFSIDDSIKNGKYDIPLDIGLVSLKIEKGKINGRVIINHKNGIKDVIMYKDNIIDGIYCRYNKQGKIIKKAIFVKGVEDLA